MKLREEKLISNQTFISCWFILSIVVFKFRDNQILKILTDGTEINNIFHAVFIGFLFTWPVFVLIGISFLLGEYGGYFIKKTIRR